MNMFSHTATEYRGDAACSSLARCTREELGASERRYKELADH